MKLSVSILLEEFPFKNELQMILKGTQSPYLNLPAIFTAKQYMQDITKLYVCDATELNQIIFLPENITCVCIGTPLHWNEYLEQRINLIAVSKKESLVNVFNEILNRFFYYNNWETELQQLIIAQKTLQELIDATDKVIGWPLAIIDIAQGTLAVSRFYDSDDIIWQEQLKGYLNTSTLQSDNVRGSQIEASAGPVQLYSVMSNRILLSQAIRIKNKSVGYVSAHRPRADGKYFTKGVEHLIDIFTQYVTKYMSSMEFYTNTSGKSFEHVLINILERKIEEESVIYERAEYLQYDLSGSKEMIVLELAESKTHNISQLKEQITEIFPKHICIAYYGNLVLFGSNLKEPSPNFFEKLESWARERTISIGISIRFTKVGQIADRYVQAEKAISFGKVLNKDRAVHRYEDYILMHACETLAKQFDDPDIFIHPLIVRLNTLEKERNIPLLKSLYQYLRCEHNISKAAEMLYLHRNTLQYRLNMIQEFLQIDFRDEDLRMEILFSFCMIEYMETFLHYDPFVDNSHDFQ